MFVKIGHFLIFLMMFGMMAVIVLFIAYGDQTSCEYKKEICMQYSGRFQPTSNCNAKYLWCLGNEKRAIEK